MDSENDFGPDGAARKLWHSILRKCHKNAEKGKGVRLTPREAQAMAIMFEEGVDA